MKNLKDLRQQRATKASRGKAALEEMKALEAKGDAITAEEATKLEALETELSALEDAVPALDREIAAMEAAQRRGVLFAAPSAAALAAGRAYDTDPALTGGFKSIAHFASSVAGLITGSGGVSMDAAASNYMQNQGTAGEGYLVPPSFSTDIWDIAFNEVDLFNMASPEPITGNTTIKPKDETTPWGALGVQAVWRSEAQAMTASKLSLGAEIMQLHELYAFCGASSELLADTKALENRLTKQAGRAISWQASEAVMWGNGAGKPTGFMSAPSLIVVAPDAGQPTATISVSNIARMVARILRVGGKPVFLANQDILPQLVGLVIPNTNTPAYLPSNSPAQQSPWDGYLLGYPLMFSEHAQTLGTSGDLSCMNMSGYYAANKEGGVDFASSIHLWFDQNLTAFRWTFRLAGQPILSKPVAPAKGATTKSHFITLATRP